jgi:hypothetical protein
MRKYARYTQMRWAGVVVGTTFMLVSWSEAATTVNLTVSRQYPTAGCTSGYLAVDGTIISYTLERPWVGNITNISSVPDGTYNGIIRYDKTDHWRIELTDVPGRSNVQIHVGNEPDQTKGCVLVGDKLGVDLCSLKGSAGAYAKLKKAFYGTEAPGTFEPRQIKVAFSGGVGKENHDPRR